MLQDYLGGCGGGKAEEVATVEAGGASEMVEWLYENVWEEYMVMNAEAEVIEEVMKGHQAGI